MAGARYAQFCALARAAEIIGERWTLLIVRELLLGPRRFADLSARLDGVSPTVLTGRLNALVERGIVRREALPQPFNAQVYALTPAGEALRPAIRELIRWGGRFLFPAHEDDAFEPEWGLLALDAITRRSPTPEQAIVLRLAHRGKQASFLVKGGPSGTTIEPGEIPGAPAIETDFETLLRIIATELPLETATERGLAKVEGPHGAARILPQLFDLAERRAARAGGEAPLCND